MNLLTLLLFLAVCVVSMGYYLRDNKVYELPVWIGFISLGWFFPMAVGGYFRADAYPEDAYWKAMLFASLCLLALWYGYMYSKKVRRVPIKWLTMEFDESRLFMAGAFFVIAGVYFQWKLWNLPRELLKNTQWTGAPVKYLFLSNVFKIGLLVLFIQYLRQGKINSPKHIVFLIPALLLILSAAVLRGRRGEMMNLLSYGLVTLWFVRKIAIPRSLLLGVFIVGVLLINGIGMYRSIMKDPLMSFPEKMKAIANAPFVESFKSNFSESGREFSNYVYYREVFEEEAAYNYGLAHWNGLVFNYVPAQIVGRELKDSLMLKLTNPISVALQKYGHQFGTGTTTTGFTDAFGSFSWFGFIKFFAIGLIMGILYRYALEGVFLAIFLYPNMLSPAMHAVSHGTHAVLFSNWVYFFALGFPLIYWARSKSSRTWKQRIRIQPDTNNIAR